jgi:hypothetical protein
MWAPTRRSAASSADFSRECFSRWTLHRRVHRFHASVRGTRFEALEPARQGVREFLGPIDRGVAIGLSVRHHDSAHMSHHFQTSSRSSARSRAPATSGGPRGTASPSLVRANPQGAAPVSEAVRDRRGASPGAPGVGPTARTWSRSTSRRHRSSSSCSRTTPAATTRSPSSRSGPTRPAYSSEFDWHGTTSAAYTSR